MRSGTLVRNAPDGPVAIFGDKQRAILCDGKSRGAAPHLFIRDDETSHEIFILPRRFAALIEEQADYFVAGADGAVPGTVERDKGTALVFGREIIALVKQDLECSRVSLEEHIGDGDPVFQIAVLAFVARIFMAADVKPRPAIEGAFLNMRRVIEGSVVSKAVSLVDDGPEFACGGLKGNAGGISNARREDFFVRAVGIEGENVGAALLGVPRGAKRTSFVPTIEPAWDARYGKHIEGDVGAGGDGEKQTFAVGSEKDVARPVMSRGNAFDYALGFRGGLEVAVFVGEPNNTVAVPDVEANSGFAVSCSRG